MSKTWICEVTPKWTIDVMDGAIRLTGVYNDNVLSSWKHLLPVGGCYGYQLYSKSRLLMVQAVVAPRKTPQYHGEH